MIALFLVLLGCRPDPVVPAQPPPVSVAPRAVDPADAVDAVVVDGGDPTALLPMIVLLHGRGDTAENFVGALEGFDGARIVALRGPLPASAGRAWISGSARELPEDEIAAQLGAQADAARSRIDLARASWPTVGAPVVTGFSQGGMMSWALALRHPDAIGAAVPIAGFAPASMVPSGPSDELRRTPIRALHGDDDNVIPIARDAAVVEAARAAGLDVVLTAFEGVPHAIRPEVRERWFAELRASVGQ